LYLKRTMMTPPPSPRLIETDAFAFEFISQLAERESWRKEIHRPIYHVHKWWAKRLGSVFRGALLGCALPEGADLGESFYSLQDFSALTVFDPFMGSGTTVGEAHKLGFTALGRDINPVAVELVRVALGPVNRTKLEIAYRALAEGVGRRIRALYQTTDRGGAPAEVLYYFWVMQVPCPQCATSVDLFPSYVIARNAYPHRKPETQVLCPSCGDVFQCLHRERHAHCACGHSFDPERGPASGAKADCPGCKANFAIKGAMKGRRPGYRLYAKLLLTQDGEKQYVPATQADFESYAECAKQLQRRAEQIPTLALEDGHNTRQAMNYGFTAWRDFFNDRQLLALMALREAIRGIEDAATRDALLILFSGTLEFNNLFASYKGEGTGAVRHMFSHHILKPERTPIEANVWGTSKSSGSFSGLYRSRLVRALDYREAPTEVNGPDSAKGRVCSLPFAKQLAEWKLPLPPRSVALSCGDSAKTGLPAESVDLVVTDPPFFDNVHYSELADFFYAWRSTEAPEVTTRSAAEVQDPDVQSFTEKLQAVFAECERILEQDGLLVFSYHHSREEGWKAVANAVLGAGFVVVNAHPVKAEMSVATPKAQAKEPIQLDILLVCRKASVAPPALSREAAVIAGNDKLERLRKAGFVLSANDRRIVRYGQLLATLRSPGEVEGIIEQPSEELARQP
jgi:putative DNA methylase